MTTVHSILRNPFLSMSLITGSIAVTGCVDSAQPTSTESDQSSEVVAGQVAITDGEVLSGLPVQTMLYEHTAQGDKLSAPGFTQTAPGEWTGSVNGTKLSIKLSPKGDAVLPRLTCQLNFYIGVATPVAGFVGGAAIGQLNCLDGASATTISTQACSNIGCTPLQSVTGVASPGAPFTSGVAIPGAVGATCSGFVGWNPPGVSVSGSGPCG